MLKIVKKYSDFV